MPAHRGVNRYPRPGDRVAPATLRQVLLEPLPADVIVGTGAAGLRLCDMDETIWHKLPAGVIRSLAERVIARVAAGCARKTFDRRHFPRPPDGVRLTDLCLEHRTQLCLAREGFKDNLQALGDRTVGDILKIRAFGPRCLVDLLSSVETLLARNRSLCQELTVAAQRLAKTPAAALARDDDPRFGPMIREIDVEASNAQELAERLLARSHDPPDVNYVIGQLERLERRITASGQGALEEELTEVFAATTHQRNREIVMSYYGWKDGRTHTLAEIGARYGMTRERTRQICAKLVRCKDGASILAPRMDRTLAFLRERLPARVDRLEQAMREAGLTKVGLGLSSVEAGAKLLGRPVPFAVVRIDRTRLAVDPAHAAVPAAAVELAKKEVYYHGLTSVARVAELVQERSAWPVEPAVVRQAVQAIDGFRWLDEPTGWFRVALSGKHGLPKVIQKVLAVAPEISVAELQTAVGRSRRICKEPPPAEVLLEFCRQMDGVWVEGERILAQRPRDWEATLTGVEAELVAVLRQHGPIMERGVLEDLCVGRGMNRFSFHAFLACSPVIAQYGHSIYGLLGVSVSREDVKTLAEKRRAERAPARVLCDHGTTADGRVWLSYRLSKAASTYAVITVPAAWKEAVSGRFELRDGAGRRVGTLAAKYGRAWGLGAFLRRRAAQVGDRVVLTLDLKNRTATIAVNP